MFWKKKKAKPINPKTEIKIEKIYLNKNLDAYRAGLAMFLTEYYYSMPIEEVAKIQVLFSTVCPSINFTGMNLLEATHLLDEQQLLHLQNLVEQNFKIVKH